LSRIVLFDFDGTLLRGDSGARLLRQLIGEQRWRRLLALSSLPLLLLFRWPRCSVLAVSWFSWLATVGRSEAALVERRRQFVARCAGRAERLLLAPAVARLNAHVAAGDTVLIVTGSEAGLASALWQALGGPPVPVIGSRTRRRFGGEVAAFHCFGVRKLEALAERGILPPFAAMYSDSAADLPLLQAAERAVLVSACRRTEQRIRRRLPALECLAPESPSVGCR
jgi:phosphatidylglycerophosphatase C